MGLLWGKAFNGGRVLTVSIDIYIYIYMHFDVLIICTIDALACSAIVNMCVIYREYNMHVNYYLDRENCIL